MIFYDTSALLDLKERAFDGAEPFLISSTVLSELENIKTSAIKSDDVKYAARKVTRLLRDNPTAYTVISVRESMIDDVHVKLGYWCETNDDKIMVAAWHVKESCVPDGEALTFVTNDLCCENLARNIFGLDVIRTQPATKAGDAVYKGWTEIQLADGGEEALAAFYQDPAAAGVNLANTPTNGYLIIKGPDNETVGLMRWDGTKYVPIKYKNLNNQYSGKVKPLNDQQKLAFDMLQNENITIKLLLGVYGSGKDFLMVNHALSLIEKGEYDKIVWVRNNIEVKNSKPIGFLPGSLNEKIFPFAGPLIDHLGGEIALQRAIDDQTIELQHLGFMRGRSWDKAIIISSEAENLTKEHIQLLIGRVGKGSTLWLNGDLRQTDENIFESNSGIRKMIERLNQDEHFSVVYLSVTERSETARLADLLDD